MVDAELATLLRLFSAFPTSVCSHAAYQLNTGEGVRRRPPARLESLKAKKESVPSREKCVEKMRLVEERRKVFCVSVFVCVCGGGLPLNPIVYIFLISVKRR